MNIKELYPEAAEFLYMYRYCWDDLDMTDEEAIADKIVWHQGREDCEDYIRESEALLALEGFPWKQASRLSNRPQPDEQATRVWLENLLELIAARLDGAESSYVYGRPMGGAQADIATANTGIADAVFGRSPRISNEITGNLS